jgi:tetratricopeptide (TPR) repeat protein
MKNVFLTLLLLTLVITNSFSQKSNLVKADNYRKYEQLDKAKEAIDAATLNEQTKVMEKTWYYRGLIYHALYNNPVYGYLCERCLETAYDAFTKANEINPKSEWSTEITSVRLPLLCRDFFERGVKQFNNQQYTEALTSFEKVQKILPGDTSSLLNSAYSAEKGKNYDKAKDYYTRLISMHYKDPSIYMSLSNLYKQQKDTTRALITIQEGRKEFPDSMNVILSEINLLLSMGKNREAVDAINTAIAKDPKNSSLYLALGSSYDNIANPKDAAGNDLAKPVNYSELMTKAEQAYMKGIEVNPSSFELNYNLGAIYFNQAAELANTANNIKSVTEYDKAKLRYISKFQDAQPYLERALELSPNDRSTLISLRQLYLQTNQTEKYNKVKSILDNMK